MKSETGQATGETSMAGNHQDLFFQQIGESSLPLLTAQEEIELAQRIKAGKISAQVLENSPSLSPEERSQHETILTEAQDARVHMAQANMGLVVSVAAHYLGGDLSLPELTQEGYVGLMLAVDKYDSTRGYRFSTFATWKIKGEIQRALRASQREDHEELLEPILRSSNSPNPQDIVIRNQLIQAINEVLSNLTPRQERILRSRLGLTISNNPHTLEEIAAMLGVTRERIRQIEQEAISNLQQAQSNGGNLQDY